MAFKQMGAASLLLLLLQMHHTVSSAALPEQQYPDVWLTGFEPNEMDGQPVEPACKIIMFTETPPTPTPKPTTTPRPVTVKQAQPPVPTARRSVGPLKPPSFPPSFPANGKPAVGRGSVPGRRLVLPSVPLPGNRLLPALAPPEKLNIPAGSTFPNYGIVPAILPVPRRTHIQAFFSPASGWASLLRSRYAQRMAAARTHAVSSSSSSEEYRG